MENYEKNIDPEENKVETEPAGELIEAEIIEEVETKTEEETASGDPGNDSAPQEDEAQSDGSDVLESKEASDDIISVAEGLAAIRNPFLTAEIEAVKALAGAAEDGSDYDRPREKLKDDCGLFKGFTIRKAIVTAAAAIAVAVVLVFTMAAAVAVAGDRTRQPSDFDMVDAHEAAEAARERAESRAPLAGEIETEQFKVTLDFYDREDIELYTTKMTLAEILDCSGIELLEGEEPTVSLDTMIGNDATISFDKFENTTDVVTGKLPYESEVRETDYIPRGTTNYIQYGAEGEGEKVYAVRLKNGVEISRELVSESVTVAPTKEIYELGVGGSFVGSDGNTYTYSYRRVVKATYYYLPNDPVTYLGNKPDQRTLAVDKNVIPLGTWLYVKNDKYDFGLRQAQDIGGAVKGDMIDIWLDGSETGYASFVNQGVHYDMEVYYVD